MSAYIVDREHIVYLVTAAMSHAMRDRGPFYYYNRHVEDRAERSNQLGSGDYERAAEIANMLWMENVKSVSYRYPGESSATLPGPIGEDFVITAADFRVFAPTPKSVQVLKACNCFAYQSCEHPGWPESEAFAFIEALKEAAIRDLPGYEDAEWGAPKAETNSVLMPG